MAMTAPPKWDPNSPYADALMGQMTGRLPPGLSPAAAQAYQAAMDRTYAQGPAGVGSMDAGGSDLGWLAQQNAMGAAQGAGSGGGAPGASGSGYAPGGTGQARVDNARNMMYDLAGNRLSQVTNDPMDAMLLQTLTNRVNGTDVPYNATTTNAMFSDAANQAGAAEAAMAHRIQGNPADPSYQAQLNQLMANRQGQVMDARRSIDMTANRANYDARTGAIGQGAAVDAGYQDRITDASRNLQGLYRGETATNETPGGSYMPYGGNYGGLAASYPAYGNQYSPPAASSAPATSAPGGNSGIDWSSMWRGGDPSYQPGPYDLGGNQTGADRRAAPSAPTYGPAENIVPASYDIGWGKPGAAAKPAGSYRPRFQPS